MNKTINTQGTDDLGFIDLVARLTPSEKDNSIVNFLTTFFSAIIPKFKNGDGSFKLLSK